MVFATILLSGGCTGHYNRIHEGRVEMYLKAPQAHSVVLVISGDRFQQLPARQDRSGSWRVTVDGLHEFKYFYLVDGKVYLPDCPLRDNDDFGSNNCVFSP